MNQIKCTSVFEKLKPFAVHILINKVGRFWVEKRDSLQTDRPSTMWPYKLIAQVGGKSAKKLEEGERSTSKSTLWSHFHLNLKF